MTSQQVLGPFTLGERPGASVWIADDSRSGERVAIKILTRELPKDEAQREELVRDIRVSAAIYHPFIVPIQEILPVEDSLVMVMKLVEGTPLGARPSGTPAPQEETLSIGYQLASAARYLHARGVVHCNIAGDSVIIGGDGKVALGGLNLSNLRRRERQSTAWQQKGTDARAVAYMAPEQISSHAISDRTDVFSIGVVLYQLSTGFLPFPGMTAGDIAHTIVEGQPVSPKAVNPEISASVLSVLGRCLFRDPARRLAGVKEVSDAIERADPRIPGIVAELEKTLVVPDARASDERRKLLLVADLADYDSLRVTDEAAAMRCAARMQQILGESVYLFDGKVLDPFGACVIAELPSVDAALEAARKGEFDVAPENQEGDILRVRLLLHAGEVAMVEGVPGGPAIERALAALAQVPAGTLFVSEEFVKEGRGKVRLRDAGAKGGVKLYTIVPGEPQVVAETEVDLSTGSFASEAESEMAARLSMEAAQQARQRMFVLAAALLALVIFGAAGLMWMRQAGDRAPVEQVQATAALEDSGPTEANPRIVHIAPFDVDSDDPVMLDRATAIRFVASAILRTRRELRLVEEEEPESLTVTVRVRGKGEEAVITALAAQTSESAPLTDVSSGVNLVTRAVLTAAKSKPPAEVTPVAMNAFGEAAMARAAGETRRAENALRTALAADDKFLPAQLLAMELFASMGRDADALAAARQVMALDASNVAATRTAARASLIGGDLRQSFALYSAVIERVPNDSEALNLFARFAAATGDVERFTKYVGRLRGLPSFQVTAHEPDIIAASGRIDTAIQRYYAIEEKEPNNAALALKIGRLAILRHSMPIAQLELKKLEHLDPLYGRHLLKAYIDAENRRRKDAVASLEKALVAMMPGDSYWTSAAEVYAIMADTRGTLDALEKAAHRKEPTAAYVLANPLFRYLENEPRFRQLQTRLIAQQAEIKAAFEAVQ
ncbi:MAG TPA: protein kinase [Thermoanaerobaculia bacterium]